MCRQADRGRERERQASEQADRQTGAERGRRAGGQADRQTGTERGRDRQVGKQTDSQTNREG